MTDAHLLACCGPYWGKSVDAAADLMHVPT
jgi:hypothetical protein